MSKELLEEIERIVGMHGGSIIFIKREYVNWLIEQAEQNKRYREVLERIEHYDTYAIDIEMASEMARKVRGSN